MGLPELVPSMLVSSYQEFGMIGESEPMQKIYRLIRAIAPTAATVLITGETGTGKEIAARSIYSKSKRKDRPFYAVNCGALPDTLLENELFGSERGAFTGAYQEQKGFFEAASSGTLFLDEIADSSQGFQVKLLRVLDCGQFYRLGSRDVKTTDARIITGTNRNPESEIATGKFRADLFHRLNIATIHMPPLRDRERDVLLLADHFCTSYGKKHDQDAILAPDACELLLTYHWPGNVRELASFVERAIIYRLTPDQDLCREYLETLPPFNNGPVKRNGAYISLFSNEFTLPNIMNAIIADRYLSLELDSTKTARSLGVSMTELMLWLRKHEIRTAPRDQLRHYLEDLRDLAPKDSPNEFSSSDAGFAIPSGYATIHDYMRACESEAIISAVITSQNYEEAARKLGLNPTYLFRRIKNLELRHLIEKSKTNSSPGCLTVMPSSQPEPERASAASQGPAP